MARTIMIVDDSNIMRVTVNGILSEAGYKVVEAENGSVALEKVESCNIDLVISDVNMPVMDGLTFVQKLKSMDKYKFLPVIMLTTVTGQDEMARGKAAGVKAWMVKPFDKQKLLGAVSKLLGV